MNEAEGSKFLIGCKADQSEKGLGWAFKPFTKVPHSVFVFRSLSAIEIKKKRKEFFSAQSLVFSVTESPVITAYFLKYIIYMFVM